IYIIREYLSAAYRSRLAVGEFTSPCASQQERSEGDSIRHGLGALIASRGSPVFQTTSSRILPHISIEDDGHDPDARCLPRLPGRRLKCGTVPLMHHHPIVHLYLAVLRLAAYWNRS